MRYGLCVVVVVVNNIRDWSLFFLTNSFLLSLFNTVVFSHLCLSQIFPSTGTFHHTVDGTGQDIAIYCSPRVLLGVSKDSRSASYLRTEVDVVELDERIETMVSQSAGNPLPRLEGGS